MREAYALDTFENVDTAVDKSYQMREMIMAHDLGTRHQTKGRKEGLRFDELMKVLRIKSSTSSKLKMLAVSGKTVEERVRNFIIGETNEEEPTEKSVKMALFVANGVLPTQRLSSAPLESSILMRFISSPNWYGEMRMDARSALILANFTVPLFMGGTMKDTFDVSIIATQAKTMDDSRGRSAGSFRSRTPSTFYSCRRAKTNQSSSRNDSAISRSCTRRFERAVVTTSRASRRAFSHRTRPASILTSSRCVR